MPDEVEESETQDSKVEEDVEEPEEKSGKPKKRTKQEKGIFNYYKIDNETVIRQRPFCERCGPGYFMADHGNRYTCGHCGFTRYKQNQ